MSKEQYLQYISQLAAKNIVTEEEVIASYRSGKKTTTDQALTRHLSVADALYSIGGAIVFMGIGVLVYQNWESLSTVTRIIVTLGSSVAAYIVGVLFMRYERLEAVSQAFFLISALVAPLGLAVVFHEAGMDVGSNRVQSLMSAILVTTYLASLATFRKTIFTVFSIIFGTWLFFSITSLLIGGRPHVDELKFYEYRILAVGLSYMLLSYSFAQRKVDTLAHWLYSIGVMSFLGAALALGGWSPNQSVVWEVIFPGLSLGTVFLGTYLKSRSFITFGSGYLMLYILKITGEYFTDTLGWPLALVIAGLALIGVGYGTFQLNKRYVAEELIKTP